MELQKHSTRNLAISAGRSFLAAVQALWPEVRGACLALSEVNEHSQTAPAPCLRWGSGGKRWSCPQTSPALVWSCLQRKDHPDRIIYFQTRYRDSACVDISGGACALCNNSRPCCCFLFFFFKPMQCSFILYLQKEPPHCIPPPPPKMPFTNIEKLKTWWWHVNLVELLWNIAFVIKLLQDDFVVIAWLLAK